MTLMCLHSVVKRQFAELHLVIFCRDLMRD